VKEVKEMVEPDLLVSLTLMLLILLAVLEWKTSTRGRHGGKGTRPTR
jgi:hypothetical protein